MFTTTAERSEFEQRQPNASDMLGSDMLGITLLGCDIFHLSLNLPIGLHRLVVDSAPSEELVACADQAFMRSLKKKQNLTELNRT